MQWCTDPTAVSVLVGPCCPALLNCIDVHREAEIRNQFSFVCIFFNAWQNLVNFFTYIKESTSYNSVYLISGSYNNFLTFLCKKSDVGYYAINHVHHHHHHHLFAEYAKMNSKICNVPDTKANVHDWWLIITG